MENGNRPTGSAGRLLLCFDFEGSYGMPYDVPYDLARSAELILEELARHEAVAVFFVVGRIIEDHPEIVSAMSAAGHEIGLHGYEHDDLSVYDDKAIVRLEEDLARVSSLAEGITGRRPRAFRAPYLLAPHFYRADVYSMLRAQEFRWVSNREVRYPVELLRPGLCPMPRAWRGPGDAPRLVRNKPLLAALNAGLVAKENFHGSPVGRLRWLLGDRAPFVRDGLPEVPVYAPLDCDLVGLPTPTEATSPEALAYSRAVIREAASARPGELSMITFHDWIVSGGNRLGLLADALTAANDSGTTISTIARNPDWLPQAG